MHGSPSPPPARISGSGSSSCASSRSSTAAARALRREHAAQRRARGYGPVLLREQSALPSMSAADDFALPPREAVIASAAPPEATWKTLEVLCGYRIVLAMVVGGAFGFFSI